MSRSIHLAAAVAIAATALAVAGPAPSSFASGPEGCVVTAPANPQYGDPCTYKATSQGGIVGAGSFKVTIKRGKKKVVFTDKQGNDQMIGAIQPGDVVTAQVTSPYGFVAVGNPSPAGVPAP